MRDRLIFTGQLIFTLLVAAFLVVPAILSISAGVTVNYFRGIQSGLTLQWVVQVWELYAGTILLSFVVAFATLAVTLAVGVPAAYALHVWGGRLSRIVEEIITLPLAIPGLAIALALLLTYGGFGNFRRSWMFILVGHVPYKGATQAATDVAAGQIPVAFQGLGTVAALVRGGQVRLIGVTTEKRLSQFPDVPTVSESGLPGFFFNSWFAILAPAGTPKDIIARLNAEVLKAVGDPEVRRKLEELGFAVRGSSAEELRTMTRDQLAKYERVIRETGIAKE